jgi:glycosyltransferase involved in cell wall biosynthesis
MVYNIAHIGCLPEMKGIELFNRLSCDKSINVKWFVIGPLEIHEKQKLYDWSNVVSTGWFNGFNELKHYIELFNIDLIVSFSMCPESFSYTLSEAWKLGLPVVGSSLGAIGNRIKKCNGGWVVNVYDYDDVKLTIKTILDNPLIFETKKRNINTIELKTLEDMKCEYNEIYRDIIG